MKDNNIKCQQQGAALIMLVFMLALIFTAFAIGKTTGIEYKAINDFKTAKALADAKEAILGWSVQQSTPGQLPCPEDATLVGTPDEGTAQLVCALPAIGRLPWKTLDLGNIVDGNNDKLWYVISTGFRDPPINLNTVAGLSLNAVPNSAVAIVFSPGVAFPTQNRAASDSPPAAVAEYLDLTNNDGDVTFVSSGDANVFNDRLLAISKNELFDLVAKRILREVRGDNAQGLVKFHADNTNYPFADIDGDGIANDLMENGTPSYAGAPDSLVFSASRSTLVDNAWPSLINYSVSADRQSVNLTLNSKSLSVSP